MIDFTKMLLDCVGWDSVGLVMDGSCGRGGGFCDSFYPMHLVTCGYFTVKSK